MPRFFVEDVSDGHISVSGADAKHISGSLRMEVGEAVTLCRDGTDYECEIEEIGSENVLCRIISETKSENEPNISLTLYQAMPKGDKLETIIQKAVELGAERIVPVMTRRCISRPDERSFEKKLERYRKIALEAAKQSGRGIIPKISGMLSFDDAVKKASEDDLAIICYENKGGKRFSELDIKPQMKISLIIGSEGGFEEEEVKSAEKSCVQPVWMGNRILRCETAPLAAISVIMSISGNL